MDHFNHSLQTEEVFSFHHLSAWREKNPQKNDISPRFQTKQPGGTWASLSQPHRIPSKKRKMTLNHIKEKHLSLQGPSSHVTLNRFMLTKRRMSPEEPLKNWGVGWGICWVDSYQVRALITFPTCAGIQRSVLVGFALFKLHHATFSVPLPIPQWMMAFTEVYTVTLCHGIDTSTWCRDSSGPGLLRGGISNEASSVKFKIVVTHATVWCLLWKCFN